MIKEEYKGITELEDMYQTEKMTNWYKTELLKQTAKFTIIPLCFLVTYLAVGLLYAADLLISSEATFISKITAIYIFTAIAIPTFLIIEIRSSLKRIVDVKLILAKPYKPEDQ